MEAEQTSQCYSCQLSLETVNKLGRCSVDYSKGVLTARSPQGRDLCFFLESSIYVSIFPFDSQSSARKRVMSPWDIFETILLLQVECPILFSFPSLLRVLLG